MVRDRFYSSQAWKITRVAVLDRDGHKCQIRGEGCLIEANAVDHIVPKLDAPNLALDPANLRAACRQCNNMRAARQKAEEGWRRSPTHITLVWGPPCAGKSTHVAECKTPGDLVVDFDLIAAALGSQSSHDFDPAMRHAAALARFSVIRMLRRGEEPGFARAWIISSAVDAISQFPHHEAILIDPGEDVALERTLDRTHPTLTASVIRRWYSTRSTTDGVSSRDWADASR